MRRRLGTMLFAAALVLAPARSAVAHPGEDARLKQLAARVEAAPDDVDLRVRIADELLRAGHPGDALVQARRIAKIDPDAVEADRIRAEAFVARGRDEAGLEAYDQYLERAPAGPQKGKAFAARARIHRRADRLEASRADFDAALEHAVTPALVLERGALDEARDRLDEAALGYRDGLDRLGPAVTLQLALARVELRRGQARLALEVIDQLLSERPGHSDWVLLRAEALDQLDQPVAALFHRVAAFALAHRALARRDITLRREALARAELALGHPQEPPR